MTIRRVRLTRVSSGSANMSLMRELDFWIENTKGKRSASDAAIDIDDERLAFRKLALVQVQFSHQTPWQTFLTFRPSGTFNFRLSIRISELLLTSAVKFLVQSFWLPSGYYNYFWWRLEYSIDVWAENHGLPLLPSVDWLARLSDSGSSYSGNIPGCCLLSAWLCDLRRLSSLADRRAGMNGYWFIVGL